jgi:hypothetical protein|tara:strand:- start:4216 stop:5559 length:1344 start_codon:yes stop_codon:yes gene_type:complete
MLRKTVQVVHCVDTEGPLFESLPETFKRLKEIFGVELSASREVLEQLQRCEIDLGGLEQEVARVFHPQLLNYNETWDQVDTMLEDIMSKEFRQRFPDSFNQGWIYNWHCLDHVGYKDNPRRREMGYHSVFDHYNSILEASEVNSRDGLHFHYHPMPFTRRANHCATHYFASGDTLFQILARDIIDRCWFPCVNRPGFHATRPDSHWFLEQFIPFDYANQACNQDYSKQKDLSDGRFGDWRRSPKTWQPYHPSHDDYQVPGHCRRWIARCLNVGMRLRCLEQADVNQAFSEAQEGIAVILSFANHDYRDMRPDVESVHAMLVHAREQFPDVRFSYCEAREAMRQALALPTKPPCRLRLNLEGSILHVQSDTPIFGPQPFFVVRNRSGEYYHDNMDFQESFRVWTYVFDESNFPLDSLEKIGIACCDSTGNVSVAVLDVLSGEILQRHH